MSDYCRGSVVFFLIKELIPPDITSCDYDTFSPTTQVDPLPQMDAIVTLPYFCFLRILSAALSWEPLPCLEEEIDLILFDLGVVIEEEEVELLSSILKHWLAKKKVWITHLMVELSDRYQNRCRNSVPM